MAVRIQWPSVRDIRNFCSCRKAMYSPKRRRKLFMDPAWAIPAAPAGSTTDILSFSRLLATTFTGYDVTPSSGGSLTINSQPVGNYEYTTRKGNTTISSFNATDWFTNTKDTTSSWIVVNGNLTINSGQTLIPPTRKLFTVLYVTGNLTLNGSISMSSRGANHSGTGDSGGATSAVDIRIGTGTFGAVTNPQIPAAGGAGGAARVASSNGQNGTAGTAGGTGGGSSGQAFSSGTSGAGAAGTCFSGGGGGGGVLGGTAGAAVANGGRGGAGAGAVSGGGAGNPGGAGTGLPYGPDGESGTGGTLIVIVGGTFSGNGTITANGANGGGYSGQIFGGSSGGGSITVLYGTDSSTITPVANGGNSGQGGSGGAGTARKLAIGAN